MKIKTQMGLLMGFTIILPFLCLAEININRRFKSDNNEILQEFYKVSPEGKFSKEKKRPLPPPDDRFDGEFMHEMPDSPEPDENNQTKDDWERVEEKLRHMPPENEAVIIEKAKVIVSTIPELPVGTTIAGKEIWDLIDKTNHRYIYKFETPKDSDINNQILLISRTDLRLRNKKALFRNILFITVATFIILTLALIYSISTSLFNSLIRLEEQTEKLANGEFSTPLELKKFKKKNEMFNFAQNLETLRIALKSSKEKKSLFIMGISHDLRTPIAVIKGYLEALNDEILTTKDEQKEAYTIINSKINQLENMINDLINYEKLDSSNWKDDFIECNLYDFAKPLLDSAIAHGSILKRNVSGEILVDKNTKIKMDPNLVTRLVENLFSNATRYTKENGKIIFLLKENEDSIIFSIKDDGCGMKKEDLSKIFDLFYRSSNSRTEPGMGIGLNVVKHIVETHGWKIDVNSELDIGSEFTITMPKIVD